VLTPEGGVDEVVKVTWDGNQGLLTFAPDAALAPGSYTLVWPALRGLNTAAPGLGATVHFAVGAADVAPPAFDGLTGVTWELERRNNDCTGSLENRMVFSLSLAPADDDGGRDGLTLVVFQSSGSGVEVDGGSLPVLTTAMPVSGQRAQVKLPVSDATGHVCFAALARDLTGKISSGGSHTVCVETTAPPFFRGCAVAATGSASGASIAASSGAGRAAGPLVFASLVLVGARRRRARRAPAA